MHPWLALVYGDFRLGVSSTDIEPTSTGDCPFSGTDSITLTSSFTGTTRDHNICSI
jgi:hypothetical protein